MSGNSAMRVGILSDTHLASATDRRGLQELAKTHFADVAAILHAGDVGDLDWLAYEIFPGISIQAVAGNCDMVDGDPRMPAQRIVELGRWRIGVIHGWGAPEGIVQRIAPLFTNVDAVIFGHSHQRYLERRGAITFFNPGSPTFPRGGPRSAGLLTLDDSRLDFRHLTL